MPGREVDKGEVRSFGSKSSRLRVRAAGGVAAAALRMPTVVPKWRATPDDDEHYTYAVALR